MAIDQTRILVLALALQALQSDAQVLSPVIRQVNGQAVLDLPGEMANALQRFNPEFKTWKQSEYSVQAPPAPIKDSAGDQAPFALILDANKDGVPDVILDGHDRHRCLLLCVLSRGKHYSVATLDSSALISPADQVSYDEGKKVIGLRYILSPVCQWTSQDPFDPKHTFVFQVVYPQESDSLGKVLGNGGSISYFFEHGVFVRGDFDPL